MTFLGLTFLNPLILYALAGLPILWFLLRLFPPSPREIYLPTARFLSGLQAQTSLVQKTSWWILLLRSLIFTCLILSLAQPSLQQVEKNTARGPLRIVFDNNWASAQSWSVQIEKAEEILKEARQSNRLVQFITTTDGDNKNNFATAREALAYLKSIEPQPFSADLNQTCKTLRQDAETIWISAGLADDGLNECLEKSAQLGDTIVLLPDNQPQIIREAENNAIIAGAGGAYLKGSAQGNASIGIVIESETKSSKHPFTEAFYIARATEEFAKVTEASLDKTIEQNPGVIIMPDIVDFSEKNMNDLSKWIDGGGILLRFSGPRMAAANQNSLVPVALLSGERALDGPVAGNQALKLVEFTEASPFSGSAIPDITVNRQLLALPDAQLNDHVWAKLSDQTPLITAKSKGKGLIVLVHTTATPGWSDFILSGFTISLMRELTEISQIEDKSKIENTNILPPYLTLDGWGNLQEAETAQPLARSELASIKPSGQHPPGLYGSASRNLPLNLGDVLPELAYISDLPNDIKKSSLKLRHDNLPLDTLLLILAGFLFLIDWLVYLYFTGRFSLSKKHLFWISLFVLSLPQNVQANDIDRAAHIHLACVASGITAVDTACLRGLEHLSEEAKLRTSSDISSAVIVDPAKDDLSFYPLLYWPVDAQMPQLPAAAIKSLQDYIENGGMIFIDTRDGGFDNGQIVPSANAAKLQEVLSGMNLPRLVIAPKDFILFKSFYLLNKNRQQDLIGPIWTDAQSISEDGKTAGKISSVMIGGDNWLSKWSASTNGLEQEMSYRFGINLVLYALTGNYKADQVHMTKILRRMN